MLLLFHPIWGTCLQIHPRLRKHRCILLLATWQLSVTSDTEGWVSNNQADSECPFLGVCSLKLCQKTCCSWKERQEDEEQTTAIIHGVCKSWVFYRRTTIHFGSLFYPSGDFLTYPFFLYHPLYIHSQRDIYIRALQHVVSISYVVLTIVWLDIKAL